MIDVHNFFDNEDAGDCAAFNAAEWSAVAYEDRIVSMSVALLNTEHAWRRGGSTSTYADSPLEDVASDLRSMGFEVCDDEDEVLTDVLRDLAWRREVFRG